VDAEPEAATGVVHPYLNRKHIFMAGAYWQEADAEIRETRDPLPRVALNLGHLGVDETDTTWYVEYRYRFGERWSLVAAGQSFSGSGEIGLTRDINFGRVTFLAGSSLRTELDVNTYFLDVMYHAYKTSRAEIAVGGGLHVFDFDASVKGNLTLENRFVDRSRELVASNSDLLAPLPNLRLQAFYGITDRWAIMGNMGWLSANVDEWEGHFSYIHLRTHVRLWENVGLAIGYQFTDVDVSRDRRRNSSEYDIEFTGPSAMITLAF
jgi:hypothetical protein